MTDGGVATALNRAERALERIEAALARQREKPNGEAQLREKVREAIAELDELIRAVG
jgi:ABC-type Zn uptake system ZnuABC Zn-binding protein ZnuA